MASDADWVEDVRRWFFAGRVTAPEAAPPATDADAGALGYEAADPVLQARHWPDAALVSSATPARR